MLLTNLADVIREHTNLEVIEEPGWKTRGHGEFRVDQLQAIIAHHTAAAASAYRKNPYPSLETVRDGRPGLDGPLAQLGLQRDLKVRVIAAGVCWHAGVTFWPWQDNWHALGIEAEHDGVSPWPDDLYGAYVELCAGLQKGYRTPYGVWAHKEIAKPKGRKTDPNFSMPEFRTDVARWTGDENDMADPETKAALTRIEQTLAGYIALDGKRWAQTQDTIQVLRREESSRYGDMVSRDSADRSRDEALRALELADAGRDTEIKALLQRLVDDPQSPVNADDVATLTATAAQ